MKKLNNEQKREFINEELTALINKNAKSIEEVEAYEINYNGKLGQNEEINKVLYNEILNPSKLKEKTLLIAPTGSGKTYAIAEIAKKIIIDLKKNDTEYVKELRDMNARHIKKELEKFQLNKDQIAFIQKKAEYKITKKKLNEINSFNEYEVKANELEEQLKNNEHMIVILTPNKIQSEQNEFKYQIKGLVANTSTNTKDSVISAVYEKAKDIIELKENNKNLIITVIIDEAHSLIDAALFRANAISEIEDLIKIADKSILMTATPFVLQAYGFNKIYNFKANGTSTNTDKIILELTDSINSNILTKISGLKDNSQAVMRINSKKDIEYYRNEYLMKHTDNRISVLTADDKKSKVYEDIINGLLDTNIKLLLTTSLLDAGTSIEKYNKEIEMIFTAKDNKQINPDSIAQFFNRARVNAGETLKNNPRVIIQKEKEDVALDRMISGIQYASLEFITKDLIERAKNQINTHKSCLITKYQGGASIEEINAFRKYLLAFSYRDERADMNCIEDDLTINYNKLLKVALNKFYSQYQVYPEKLAKAIEYRTKAKVEIVYSYDEEVRKDINKKEKTQEEDFRDNTDLLIETLNENELLEKYISNKVDKYVLTNSLKNNEDARITQLLNDNRLTDRIKKCIDSNIELDLIKDNLINNREEFNRFSSLDKLIAQNEATRCINAYKANKMKELLGKRGIIIKAILNNLTTFNKMKTLNKKNFNLIEEEIKKTKIAYKKSDIIEYINFTFNIELNKDKVILKSLKTKFNGHIKVNFKNETKAIKQIIK